jgi:hypothetical protein
LAFAALYHNVAKKRKNRKKCLTLLLALRTHNSAVFFTLLDTTVGLDALCAQKGGHNEQTKTTLTSRSVTG